MAFSAAAASALLQALSWPWAANAPAASMTARSTRTRFMSRSQAAASRGLEPRTNGAHDAGRIEAAIREELLRISVFDERIGQSHHEDRSRDPRRGQRL